MRNIVCVLLLLLPFLLQGQERRDWGKLSGALESNLGFYMKDTKLGITPNEQFGTNTYLSLGYAVKKFRLGLQYELYEPALVGYPSQLDGNKLIQGYGEYVSGELSVRLGNIYEQFGSGLSFRSYEERSLGINNSILGGNIRWNPVSWLKLKGFAGMPRKYMKYADVLVAGADGELDISGLCESPACFFSLGGSFVWRKDYEADEYPGIVRICSGRGNFSYGVFSVGGEYTHKSSSLGYGQIPGYFSESGSALLCNLGVDMEGMGVSAEFRRLENMEFRVDNVATPSTVNLNYVPALTRQHKYTLPALYPYTVLQNGEIGGQADFFGELNWGERPLKISLNGAYYNRLKVENILEDLAVAENSMFRELGLELERKWKGDVKTIFSWVMQHISETALEGFGDRMIKSQVMVGDILYRMTPRQSVRLELQHMWSSGLADEGWVFGLAEYGFAPHWMLNVSDLYNYNTSGTSVHYYTVGGSFTSGAFRVSLSYGRNRAGMQCVGGICRYVPDYTGFNCSLTLTL